jgi:peptide/nickel transport system permease protein
MATLTRPAVRTTTALPPLRSRSLVSRFRANPRLVFGAAVIALMCLIALVAPVLAPCPPNEQVLVDRLQPPSPQHWMGTDAFGRDVLSRAMWASRLSLSIAVLSVAIATVVGLVVGISAGYFGGWLDTP